MTDDRDRRKGAAPGTEAGRPIDPDRGDPTSADARSIDVPPLTVDPPRGAPTPPDDPDGRPTDLRLARIHLRMGSLELARAELESFAGAGRLDPDALLDLAEVRWRTGDLPGAGVAAQAHLGTGEETLVALVIAAEAAAGAGHPGEAHRLASQAVDRLETAPGPALERLFAGMPRSGIWPLVPDEAPQPDGLLFAVAPTLPSGAPLQPRGATRWGQAATAPEGSSAVGASGAGLWDDALTEQVDTGQARRGAPGTASTIAAVRAADPASATEESLELHPEVVHARAALEADDHEAAVAHLTALLQRRPELARSVVEALEPGADADAAPAGSGTESQGSDVARPQAGDADAAEARGGASGPTG